MDHSKIIDEIVRSKSNISATKDKNDIKKPDKGVYLGQKYRKGDLVRDRETGESGRVIISVTKRVI